MKIKLHSSCEIEYIVQTHLCKPSVRDSPFARITGCVSSLRIYPLATTVSVAIRVNRVMLGSLCAETIKPVFEGDKI